MLNNCWVDTMTKHDLEFLLEVLQDVQAELGEEEVSDLITLALDDKVADGIQLLEQYLDRL